MKRCEKCQVSIKGTHDSCPLCGRELVGDGTRDEFPTEYPENVEKSRVLNILTVLLLINGIICLTINTIYPTPISWGKIVVVVLIGVRISLGIAVAKHKRILKYLFQQSLIIVGICIVVDYFTGNNGWGISYVLPNVCTFAMIIMYLTSRILSLHVGEYMIYFILYIIFGIIPVVFIRLDLVSSIIPSIACICTSLISICIILVFEGELMYSELRRRLHV